jgi:hypothetical protein
MVKLEKSGNDPIKSLLSSDLLIPSPTLIRKWCTHVYCLIEYPNKRKHLHYQYFHSETSRVSVIKHFIIVIVSGLFLHLFTCGIISKGYSGLHIKKIQNSTYTSTTEVSCPILLGTDPVRFLRDKSLATRGSW